jgi:hypothetical protein
MQRNRNLSHLTKFLEEVSDFFADVLTASGEIATELDRNYVRASQLDSNAHR